MAWESCEGARESIPTPGFSRPISCDDPVWPGSLGAGIALQLLKIMAAARWGAGALSAV